MKEVKSPKKPLLYYYGIVLLIIALFNLLVTPLLNRRSIEEVDYGTFMSKIEAQQIEKILHPCAAVRFHRGVINTAEVLLHLIVLVPDFAHQLFQDIFHGYQTAGTAKLIHHNG